MKPPRYVLAAFALLLGPLAGSAHAQAGNSDADLRCMAVMAKINQLPDTKHQFESLIGGYYYLGRLQAISPTMDFGSQTAAAYAKMSPADFLSETTRCEKDMMTKGHAIREIGDAMPKPAQSNGK